MKRISVIIEVGFDSIYLILSSAIGLFLIFTSLMGEMRFLAGIMVLLLAFGDAFHLVPRIQSALYGKKDKLLVALGRGKQITSITMTVFYILLWHIGSSIGNFQDSSWHIGIYFLAVIRIALCLFPQNNWTSKTPPLQWGILRNIPFFIMGLMVSFLYYYINTHINGFEWMWFAILLSFAFYLPVVLFADKKPMVGILMLPKTCTYIWMIIMCLSL